MKGKLKSMHLSYVEAEDRLLMKIITTANEEIRFWITRLYALHLFRLLSKVLLDGYGDHDEGHRSLALERRQMEGQQKAAKKRRRAQDSADDVAQDDGKAEKPPQLPMGDAPILLTRLTITGTEINHIYMLKMHPADGTGIDLRVDRGLVHQLCASLSEMEKRASWEPDLMLPGAKAMATVSASQAIN